MAERLSRLDSPGHAWIARFALLALGVAIGFAFSTTGRFTPVEVNDTTGYKEFPFDTWEQALTSIRTPGYPAFLRAVDACSGSTAAVPTLHFCAFAAAVMLLFESLARLTGRVWLPWLIAASLFSSNVLVGYVNTIATETLAAAIGLGCGALVLLWCRSPGPWLLIAIALSTSAGWLVRPVGVFLVAWIPLLGARVVAWNESLPQPADLSARRMRPHTAFAHLSVATLLPLACWIAVRAASTGHWGVASFDGYNLIGLAGQFVRPETNASLSPAQQQVVSIAVRNGQLRPKEDGVHLNDPPLHYLRIENTHDATIWADYVPPTRELVGSSTLRINAFLGELARNIIAEQPMDYFVWLVKAVRQAVRKVFSDTLQHPVSLALLIASVALFLTGPAREPMESVNHCDGRSIVRLIAYLAASHAVLNLACTIPFVPPRERMTDAAALWAPALLAAWFGSLCERRWQGARANRSPGT